MHNAVVGLMWLLDMADQKARFLAFMSPTKQFEAHRSHDLYRKIL